MTEPRLYRRRQPSVVAMQVTRDTAQAVAEWAGGTCGTDEHGKWWVRLPLIHEPAHDGTWIVRDVLPDGLGEPHTVIDRVFRYAYEESQEGP